MKYLLLAFLILSGCTSGYELTTFYVKNNTDKPMNFKAGVEKYTSMGPFVMTLPFTVLPQDSVLARKVKFKKNITPTAWFTSFNTFPVTGIKLNDPDNAANWIKTADANGNPVYTFNLAK